MLDPDRKIGGSTIPKILGRSKWGTPLDAYLELRKEKEQPTETSEDQDRGNFLEPALREWAQKKTGVMYVKPEKTIAYSDWPWATYSPDGLSIGPVGGTIAPNPNTLLEIKSPRFADLFEWGEPGTDEVPVDYLLQVSWGLMVTGRTKGIVAALIGGELRLYNIERNPALEKAMLTQAKLFVEQHVIPGVPPAPTFGDDEVILKRWPRNEKPARPFSGLSAAEKDLVRTYLEANIGRRAFEKQEETFKPAIQDLIGDTAGIVRDVALTDLPRDFPAFEHIDWKRVKPSIGVGEAFAMNKELLAKLPPAEAAELVAKYMPKEGPRKLQPYFTNPKKKV